MMGGMAAIADRRLLSLPLAVLGAMAYGALVGAQPVLAAALMGLVGVAAITIYAPVAHLTLLLVFTAIVPYQTQNALFGVGSVGLVPSDVLLLTGLARGTVVLARRPLALSEIIGLGLTVLFLLAAALQFLHGVSAGAGLSVPGDELRTLLGFGVVLVALPILQDEEARPRLFKALLATGLLLGLWGVLQWTVKLPYFPGAGVREGVALTTTGRGQLQGGLYAFPVAVTLAFAALLSGSVRGVFARGLLVAVIALNAVCVLLTFERTFWVVTVVACSFVILKASPGRRARALALAPLAVLAGMVTLAAVAPDTLTTARERLLSLNQYNTDSSVAYRLRESQQVIDEIRLRPAIGSGLGAAVWWGRPANEVPPEIHYFAHNGYLWAAWKLGVPVAILLWGSIFLAIARRGRAAGGPLTASLTSGAQASLLALALAAVTFPGVSSKTITATMGVLLGFCVLPHLSASLRHGSGRGPTHAVGAT